MDREVTEEYDQRYWSGKERGVRKYGDVITDVKMLVASIHIFTELKSRNLKTPRRHLDVGGGMGHLVKNIDSKVGINFDLSRYGLQHSVTTNNVQGNSELLPFPSGYFDLITCVDVLEHIPMKNLPITLLALKRVLSPNGRIFAIPATTDDKKIDYDRTHVTKISPEEWRKIFVNADLIIDYNLITKVARQLGYVQPAKLIPFPTLRTGLFILSK